VLGCAPGGEGSSVALDLPIPESCRSASGIPRLDELPRLVRTIEEAAMGNRVELDVSFR
jgi:hypothetical protein